MGEVFGKCPKAALASRYVQHTGDEARTAASLKNSLKRHKDDVDDVGESDNEDCWGVWQPEEALGSLQRTTREGEGERVLEEVDTRRAIGHAKIVARPAEQDCKESGKQSEEADAKHALDRQLEEFFAS